jgi:hypothetical protein
LLHERAVLFLLVAVVRTLLIEAAEHRVKQQENFLFWTTVVWLAVAVGLMLATIIWF